MGKNNEISTRSNHNALASRVYRDASIVYLYARFLQRQSSKNDIDDLFSRVALSMESASESGSKWWNIAQILSSGISVVVSHDYHTLSYVEVCGFIGNGNAKIIIAKIIS